MSRLMSFTISLVSSIVQFILISMVMLWGISVPFWVVTLPITLSWFLILLSFVFIGLAEYSKE